MFVLKFAFVWPRGWKPMEHSWVCVACTEQQAQSAPTYLFGALVQRCELAPSGARAFFNLGTTSRGGPLRLSVLSIGQFLVRVQKLAEPL